METNSTQLCKRIKANGEPCKAIAREDGLCFAHSPALAKQHTDASIKGGHNKSNAMRLQKLMPARLVPIYKLMEEVLSDVYNDKIDLKKAHTMAVVARAMVAIFTAGELEERVRSLEEKTGNNPLK
jgi:hypothetical protein